MRMPPPRSARQLVAAIVRISPNFALEPAACDQAMLSVARSKAADFELQNGEEIRSWASQNSSHPLVATAGFRPNELSLGQGRAVKMRRIEDLEGRRRRRERREMKRMEEEKEG
eukprot:3874887-Pyramimonas_sp.AAC.1